MVYYEYNYQQPENIMTSSDYFISLPESEQESFDDVLALGETAKAFKVRRNDILLDDHEKDPRHFTKAEAQEYLEVNPKTLDRYCQLLNVDPKRFEDAAWLINIHELYAIREAMRDSGTFRHKKFIRTEKQRCQVIAIANQKGGVSKTVSVGTIGACIASQYHDEFRVGLIDTDPQGTLSLFHLPDRHNEECRDNIFGFGDLVSGEFELDEGESLKDLVSSAFVQTTIPNLRILPAMETDRQLEGKLHAKILSGEIKNPYKILRDMIELVQDEFDIILIDTPPAMNFAVYNALYASTGLIIPVTPTEADRDATMNWLEHLPVIYQSMFNMCLKGHYFTKFLITNHDGKDTANAITQELNSLFGNKIYDTSLKSSEAIRVCAKDLNTIFDISKSEYPKSYKKAFGNAVTNARSVSEQIVKSIRDIWFKQDRT